MDMPVQIDIFLIILYIETPHTRNFKSLFKSIKSPLNCDDVGAPAEVPRYEKLVISSHL